MAVQAPARNENRALVLATPDSVQQALQRLDRQAAFRALLGDSVPFERFEQIVIQAIVRNPDIQRASLASLLDSVRIAATLRLEPTGMLGEGYLIRYGADAQFEAGYRGLMKLARRSGQIAAIDAQIVYVNDFFDVRLGTEPIIDHRPCLEGERGNFRGAYAYARMTTGELIVEWMPDADIQAVRKSSRNGTGSNSPWVNHFGEMARKTVLKRLMKRLPLGADAEMALRVEAEAEQDAPRPHRAPSAALAAIRGKLGVPAPQEPTDSGTEAAREGVEATEEAVVVEGSGVTEGTAPEPVPCESTSPFDGAVQCRREQGHTGVHKTESESWPQK